MELKNCKLFLQENITIVFFFRVINKQVLSNLLALVQHLMLNEFLQYLLGEEAAGRSVLYACSLCLCKSEYPTTGCVVLCVSVCAVFHTCPPMLSFWQNYLISVGLSRLPCLCHGCISPPPENLWTLVALYVVFKFCVSTTPSLHFVSKIFLETELGEALNDQEIYLKNARRTTLVLWP